MELTKITIKNFKSIQNLDFDIKKYGNSHTTMLLGINESGKSNILEAMSLLSVSSKEVNYSDICNNKNKGSDVNLMFNFITSDNFSKEIKDEITTIEKNQNPSTLDMIIQNSIILDFIFEKNIVKNINLKEGNKNYTINYEFTVNLKTDLFVKKSTQSVVDQNSGDNVSKPRFDFTTDPGENQSYDTLTPESFKEIFNKLILKVIKNNEPKSLFWDSTTTRQLVSQNVNEFKNNTDINEPLKNIFHIAGFSTNKKIKDAIEKNSDNTHRKKLNKLLSTETTKYVKKKWNHNIIFDIEFMESICNLTIQDIGEDNLLEYYPMSARSDGFNRFITILFYLSMGKISNQLILIDEPEVHLHPSAIRDLREELLKIGQVNYLFVSTHSPFMIDKEYKERNIIIKKNDNAITEKKEIKETEDINDDEVLNDAFGIDVYKDLLSPHRILVEGASERTILKKAFKVKNFEHGITNGKGSNIVTLASKFNQDNVDILVVVDDDEDGRKYKENILKIKGVYNDNNVFTIRDLVGDIANEGTIEDTLGEGYIRGKFFEEYSEHKVDDLDLNLDARAPFLNQLKVFLKKREIFDEKKFESFKIKVSDDLEIKNVEGLNNNFMLLSQLADAIHGKFNELDKI